MLTTTKRRRPKPASLSLKQQRFVSEYLKDLNGSAAAIRAGYSQKTGDVQAYALLRKPQIAKMIADAEAERLAANKITATRTLEEDRRIAFNDPRRFVTADGNLQPITNWTAEMASAVASIEVVRRNVAGGDGHSDTVVKIRFWNKVQALELLHRHLGLLDPDADDDRPTVPVFLLPPGSRVETK